MKTFSIVLTLAIASFAAAQNGLPECAKSCADTFLSGDGVGNCGTDPGCICANKDFISGISCCLIGDCDKKDQSAAVSFAHQICSANGVSVPSVVSCASSAATTTAASGSGNGGAANTTPAPTGSGASQTGPAPTSTNFAPRQTAAAGFIGGIVAAVALL